MGTPAARPCGTTRLTPDQVDQLRMGRKEARRLLDGEQHPHDLSDDFPGMTL